MHYLRRNQLLESLTLSKRRTHIFHQNVVEFHKVVVSPYLFRLIGLPPRDDPVQIADQYDYIVEVLVVVLTLSLVLILFQIEADFVTFLEVLVCTLL